MVKDTVINAEPDVTVELLTTLFDEFQSMVGELSCSIATQLPHVWVAIETVTKIAGFGAIALVDISLQDEMIVYVVQCVESGTQARIELPMEVAVNSRDSTAVVEYIQTSSDAVFKVRTHLQGTAEELQRGKEVVARMEALRRDTPGLYIDIARMVEIDRLVQSQQIFQFDWPETTQ